MYAAFLSFKWWLRFVACLFWACCIFFVNLRAVCFERCCNSLRLLGSRVYHVSEVHYRSLDVYLPPRFFPNVSVFHVCLPLLLLQEEDFQEMLRAAQVMENQYSYLFEKVIVNDDLTAAFSELRLALRSVEMDTHWVPVSWTHTWDPHGLWKEKREGLWQKCAGVWSFCVCCGWCWGRNGDKMSRRQMASFPYLSYTEMKRRSLSCGLDVVHQLWPDQSGTRLRIWV